MSRTTAAWDALYGAQTRAIGVAVTATVGAVANKPAILPAIDLNSIFASGGSAFPGEMDVQMRMSDFAAQPAENTDITFTIPGSIAVTRKILGVEPNNGIYYFTIGDPSA